MYVFDDQLKRAYESSPLSFVYYQSVDGEAVPILVSDGFCRSTGHSRESILEWLKNGLYTRIHPDDVGVVVQISEEFLHHRITYDLVFRCKLDPLNTGRESYVRIHGIGRWQTMPDGSELAVISYANLSLTKKVSKERMETYSLLRRDHFYTDPLTGLANLNYLHEFGNEKMNSLRTDGKTPNVIYVDINSMQSYNNQYGVKEGDRLLCLVADTLTKRFPDDLVAKGADDHFIIISWLDNKKSIESRLFKANKIIRSKAVGNTTGFRAGVCRAEEGLSIIETLDRAKNALKWIENNMNLEVSFFSRELNDDYLKERYLVENFDQALKKGFIKVYYHALYRVETSKIAAFEGLARWVDPEKGLICPKDFVSALLKYHQIYKLDFFIFEQVCREVIIRHDNSLPLVPVSVNFSRQDFDYADVVGKMNELYDKYDLKRYVDKSYFIIEITEQDLSIRPDSFAEQLRLIRNNGYRLWLDDFGSGYSAINVFSRFDFDLIKYDMELLRHLDDNKGMNRTILKELVYISRRFGIHTLIEGVETQKHLDFLKEIGCEMAQGYYYHKPESLDQILLRIRSGDMVKSCETPSEREDFNRRWFDFKAE